MAFMFLGSWPFRNRRVRIDEGDIVFSRLEIVDDDAREMWQLALSYSIMGKLWMRVARLIGVVSQKQGEPGGRRQSLKSYGRGTLLGARLSATHVVLYYRELVSGCIARQDSGTPSL